MIYLFAITIVAILIALRMLVRPLRNRGLNHCVISYLLQSRRRGRVRADQTVHLLLCIADHFEPQWGRPQPHIAQQRVQNWVVRYPQLFDTFRDSDGRPPRHTFFFPIDQYDADHVDGLAELCRQGYGEVEIHLHHDHDTAENLRKTLLDYSALFANRHGLLSRIEIAVQTAARSPTVSFTATGRWTTPDPTAGGAE